MAASDDERVGSVTPRGGAWRAVAGATAGRPTGRRRARASDPERGAVLTRLCAALAIALATTAWTAVAWALRPEAPPSAQPSPPAVEAGPHVAPMPALTSRYEAPRPDLDDPLRAALARLNPADRIDDRSAGVPYWPFVAPDPEREADAAGESAAPNRTQSYEVHVVATGETLLGIAIALGVDEDELATLNKLSDRDRLAVGQRLLVPPAGHKPARAVVSSRGATLRPRFIWPHRGNITTYFGERGGYWIGGRHTGLDIAGSTGEPVLAAEAGTVLEAGWSEARGFGNYVLIDHGLGFRTLYGHLSVIRVKPSQEVGRGERIGDVGSTGFSTGPHLHFEVQLDGQPVDPLAYLP